MRHELGSYGQRLPEPGVVYRRPREVWEGTPDEEPKTFPFNPSEGGTLVLPTGTDVRRPASYYKVADTLEEVQALPLGSVVRDSWEMIWQLMPDGEGQGRFWLCPGDQDEYPDNEIGLPAIVLWEGQP